MGLTGTGNQTQVTPYRKSHVRLDLPETVVAEPAFAITFNANQMLQRGPADLPNSAIKRLGAGAIALAPFQVQGHWVHERTDNGAAVIPASGYNLITSYAQENVWRSPTDLTGVTTGADAHLATTGDAYNVYRPVAGASWAQTLPRTTNDFPTLPTANIQTDIHAQTIIPYDEDQGYVYKFRTTGTKYHLPDWIHHKRFGGPVQGGSQLGTYWLACSGAGEARLYENTSTTSTPVWTFRAQFQYAQHNQASDALHVIHIWPYLNRDRSGGHIDFWAQNTAESPPSNFLTSYHAPAAENFRYTYSFKFPPPLPAQGPRVHVTGRGPVVTAVRRGLRMHWQDSVFRFPASGVFQEAPFMLPFPATLRTPFVLSWRADVPPFTSITGQLFDASTDLELTPVAGASGTSYVTYNLNYGKQHYYAKFTLSSADGKNTPVLWAYEVSRAGAFTTTLVTETAGNIIRGINISGPEADPSHETANVELEDVMNALTTLNIRASQRIRIETEFDSAIPSRRVVLMDGYSQRSTATRKGTAGTTYPDPLWRHHDSMTMGVWVRLHEAQCPGRFNLMEDPNSPEPGPGSFFPYKITDAVRIFLGYGGFGPSQIDVPDSPVRFFAAPGNPDALMVDPLANVADLVVSWLKLYLGWFLIWDANAGTPGSTGMWRARPPTNNNPYRNLWAFQTTKPSGKLTHTPGSYPNTNGMDSAGAANYTGTDSAIGGSFIRRRTLQTYVKPPEANCVLVTGTGQLKPNGGGQLALSQYAVNVKSFDFGTDSGGSPIHSADPNNPDYLGRRVPLVYVDPTLGTQAAVDWITRRLYDFTCHAIKIATFDAPLVFVRDAQDLITDTANPLHGSAAIATGYGRPLRYYDPVTVDGQQWLIRNVNPYLLNGHDSIQMAHYELEAPRIGYGIP